MNARIVLLPSAVVNHMDHVKFTAAVEKYFVPPASSRPNVLLEKLPAGCRRYKNKNGAESAPSFLSSEF